MLGMRLGGRAAPWPKRSVDGCRDVDVDLDHRAIASAPDDRLLTPADGATIRGSAVRVMVSVANFAVVDKQFQAPVPGEGHLHFYLDVNPLPTTHTFPAAGIYRSISGTSYTGTGLSAGVHTLAVQLVGNDHVPLKPPAKDAVTVTVTG